MRKGFTIIECLISVILLAITMVGSMAFYFYSTGHLAGATHKRIAEELANAKMEEIKNSDYSLINSWAGAGENVTIGGLSWQQEIYVVDVFGPPNVGIAYKKVQIRTYRNETSKFGTQQDVTIATYIAKR